MSDILKSEGLQLRKRTVFHNLHLKAGPEEDALLQDLISELRDGELFVRGSAKDLKDLTIGFHEERNVLKQQVCRLKLTLIASQPCFRFPNVSTSISATKVPKRDPLYQKP